MAPQNAVVAPLVQGATHARLRHLYIVQYIVCIKFQDLRRKEDSVWVAALQCCIWCDASQSVERKKESNCAIFANSCNKFCCSFTCQEKERLENTLCTKAEHYTIQNNNQGYCIGF